MTEMPFARQAAAYFRLGVSYKEAHDRALKDLDSFERSLKDQRGVFSKDYFVSALDNIRENMRTIKDYMEEVRELRAYSDDEGNIIEELDISFFSLEKRVSEYEQRMLASFL